MLLKSALLRLRGGDDRGGAIARIPLADTRLTVHTLLREDIFAGFLDNDMERVARAEQNIELLLKQRPGERANLLAWRGGIEVQRAVRAHEAGKPDEFTQAFPAVRRTAFAAAAKLDVRQRRRRADHRRHLRRLRAIGCRRSTARRRGRRPTIRIRCCGSSRARRSSRCPLHFKGEVLAGMAQSAQRTGRTEESAQFVDKMLTLLPNTPFEKTARQWKADPASAATTNLTCKNCHGPGRLAAKIKALPPK